MRAGRGRWLAEAGRPPAVSIAGYVVGVADGTWIAHGVKDVEAGADTNPADVLPTHVILDPARELTLLAGFTAGWEVSGASLRGQPGRVGAVQRRPRWPPPWASSPRRSRTWA